MIPIRRGAEVGLDSGQLGDAVSVGSAMADVGIGSGPGAWHEVAGFAAALLEAADEGELDEIHDGDGRGAHSAVALGKDPRSQVH
jgi:hypothetical protein